MQRVERDRRALARATAEPQLGLAVRERRPGGVQERPPLDAPARPGRGRGRVRAGGRAEARLRDLTAGRERERDAHAVAARAAARDALAVGLADAPCELEVARPQHQTTALARRSSALQRATASAATHSVTVLAERAEAEPQRAARRVGRDAHRGQRRAGARFARSRRPGRPQRPRPLVEQRDERMAVHALDQRQRVPGRALGALADDRRARHVRAQGRLVAVAHGAVARVAPAVGARGRQRRGQAGGLRDALGARSQRALLPAAEEHGLERREAATAQQTRALRAAQLVTGDGGRHGARQRADVDREGRTGLHGVEVQRHAALGADRGGLGDRLDHAGQVAGPDQAADEVAGPDRLVERAHGHAPVGVDRQRHDLAAAPLERLDRAADRRVLERRRDDAPGPVRRTPEDRDVVGLRGPAGEDDVGVLDAERRGRARARGVQPEAGVPAGPVRLRRVAEVLAQERLHRLPGLVADGRGGGVIGVDAHDRSLCTIGVRPLSCTARRRASSSACAGRS